MWQKVAGNRKSFCWLIVILKESTCFKNVLIISYKTTDIKVLYEGISLHLPGFYYYFDSSKCFPAESQWGHSEEFSTVAQSCPILLQAHELQHARLPCPSPTPRAYSNSCPSSRWCHPSISSSAIPFSSHLQSFPASRYFQWVTSLHQVTKELEFQLQHQSPMKFRTDFI